MTQAERISREIERMNSERESQAACATRELINRIMALNATIRKAQEDLAKAKSDLAAVSYEPVNAADIVG